MKKSGSGITSHNVYYVIFIIILLERDMIGIGLNEKHSVIAYEYKVLYQNAFISLYYFVLLIPIRSSIFCFARVSNVSSSFCKSESFKSLYSFDRLL